MLIDKSASFIAENVKNGEVKAVDVAEEFLEYGKKVEDLNVFNSINEDKILSYAKKVDDKRKSGKELGPLAGVPFIIKDNILVKDELTTCSSNMLKDYVSQYDAAVVSKIKDADGIPFGKSNMDEFAMGSSTEYSIFGSTKNPWDKSRVPGGSSGGSAVGVASLAAPLALGSDTGGSIRQPAAFCGIYGLKPTYGRVSRRGIVSFASSLDQIGPFSRNIEDLALSLSVISGYDKYDSTSAREGLPDFRLALDRDVRGLKVGMLQDPLLSNVDKDILEQYNLTAGRLRGLGMTVEGVKLPALQHSIEAYYIIAPAEMSSNLSRFDGLKYGLAPKSPESVDEIYRYSRTKGFGEEVKRRIIVGNYVLSEGHFESYYKKAYQVRRVIKDQLDILLQSFDLIFLPTTPTKAFKIGDNINDPVTMYLSDIFTTSANLAGIPAMSIPVAIARGLPIGMQFFAKHFDESILISVASALERVGSRIPVRRVDV